MPGHYGRSSSSGSRGSAAPGGTGGGGGGWSPGVGGQQHQPKAKAAPVSTGGGKSAALQAIAAASAKKALPPQLGGPSSAAQAAKVSGVPLGGTGLPPQLGGSSSAAQAAKFIPPVIPKGRTHPGGITGNRFDKIRNWIAKNKWKTALSGLGGLAAGAGYQTLSDINKIKGWTNMGYGTGNPVPANMLSQLKGAWVPNKVFEKLGYGAGSTKGWLTGRVSPTHFGPVEAAMKAFKSPVGKFATKALGPASVAYTAGDILTQRSKAMGTEANRISALEGPAQTQAIEDYATKMYKPYARGGLADLYRYGGFSG